MKNQRVDHKNYHAELEWLSVEWTNPQLRTMSYLTILHPLRTRARFGQVGHRLSVEWTEVLWTKTEI